MIDTLFLFSGDLFLIISTYWADRADSDDTKVKARKNWRSGGGGGGVAGGG